MFDRTVNGKCLNCEKVMISLCCQYYKWNACDVKNFPTTLLKTMLSHTENTKKKNLSRNFCRLMALLYMCECIIQWICEEISFAVEKKHLYVCSVDDKKSTFETGHALKWIYILKSFMRKPLLNFPLGNGIYVMYIKSLYLYGMNNNFRIKIRNKCTNETIIFCELNQNDSF